MSKSIHSTSISECLYMPDTVIETWATSGKKTEDTCTLGAYIYQLTTPLPHPLSPIYTNKEKFTFPSLTLLPRLSLSQVSFEIWLNQLLPLLLPCKNINIQKSYLEKCLYLSLFPFLFLVPHHTPNSTAPILSNPLIPCFPSKACLQSSCLSISLPH